MNKALSPHNTLRIWPGLRRFSSRRGVAILCVLLLASVLLLPVVSPQGFVARAEPSTVLPAVPPVRDVKDMYFGTEVNDPYRYLESLESDEVRNWAEEQSRASVARLSALSERPALYEKFQFLQAREDDQTFAVTPVPDGSWFFLKILPGQSTARLYRRDVQGKEVLILDPSLLPAPEGSRNSEQPLGIRYYRISPDGKWLACQITDGSEICTLYVLSVGENAQTLTPPYAVRDVIGPAPAWLPDSSGFFYTRVPPVEPGAERRAMFQRNQVCLHRIRPSSTTAANPAIVSDEPVLGYGLNIDLGVRPDDISFILTYQNCPWVFGMVKQGVSGMLAIYCCPVDKLNGAATPWRTIANMGDGLGSRSGKFLAVRGKDLYTISYRGDKNHRGCVVRLNIENPVLDEAQAVYEDPTGAVAAFTWARDGLYVKVAEEGASRLVLLPFTETGLGAPHAVPLQGVNAVHLLTNDDPRMPGLVFGCDGWTHPSRYLCYNADTGAVADLGFTTGEIPAICKELEARQVLVKSHDGAEVPLTIISRRDVKLDGRNPVLLSGYGAYGTVIEPIFYRANIPLLEKGGIYAIAHVRGGGQKGTEWWRDGHGEKKPNSWKDFIACAEYLTGESRLGSPDTLCAVGRSAGGITVGRAITERPELFACAVLMWGVYDTVRMELAPTGPSNVPEFGSVSTEAGFRSLLAMSTYHHVRDNTRYPAILFMHGANDSRVDLWQSLKMAARFRAATSDPTSIFLRIDATSGHDKGHNLTQYLNFDADMHAFILHYCKAKEPAPAAKDAK
ncbi:MAG TPA: prolyl oligopeptidase family serine peptidase [Candidatus Methylacidiphilales bacterium]|nr:prolyl oligopeptidase family serine peptidase [Candidatus Methylacidiphilales bacterium]